jgi:hypothetical protein
MVPILALIELNTRTGTQANLAMAVALPGTNGINALTKWPVRWIIPRRSYACTDLTVSTDAAAELRSDDVDI